MFRKKKESKIRMLSKKVGLDLDYFLKGGFWLGLFQISNLGKALILSLAFANLTSIEFYGQYNFILTFISFVSVFSFLGLRASIVQSVATKHLGTYKKAVKIIFFTSFLGTLILLATSYYYYTLADLFLSKIFFVIALLFPLYLTSVQYQPYYLGKKDFEKQALIGFFSNVISLVLILLILFSSKDLFTIILVVLFVKILFEGYFTLRIYNRLKDNKKISEKAIAHGINTSWALVPSMAVQRVENIVIGFYLGFLQLGIFALVTLIPNQFRNFLNIVSPTFLPKLSEQAKKINNRHILKHFLKLEAVYVLIIISYFLMSYFIFNIFYNQYFEYYMLSNIFALTLISVPTVVIDRYFRAKLYTTKLNILNTLMTLSMVFIVFPAIFFFTLTEVVWAKVIQHIIYTLGSLVLLMSKEK